MRLPAMNGRQIQTVLARAGFAKVGQKGSHIKMRLGDLTVTVVDHGARPLARPTMMAIFKDAELTPEDVERLLR